MWIRKCSYLRPSFPVSNFIFVFQMNYHFSAPWHDHFQSPSVGSNNFLYGFYFNISLRNRPVKKRREKVKMTFEGELCISTYPFSLYKNSSLNEQSFHWWDIKYADCLNCRALRPPPKGVPRVWYWTESDGDVQVMAIWRLWITPSLPLFAGILWLGIIVPIVASSIHQADLFANCSY